MSDRLDQTIVGIGLILCCLAPSALAQSNSKGANSSVVVGILKEVSADGSELMVLQSGELLRELHTDSKSKIYFVGITDKAARKATVGYGVKASCDKDGRIKTMSFTPPISKARPLGEERLSMTLAKLFTIVDADSNDRVGYDEFSRSVYYSPKHGPDHFRKADGDNDGSLNSDEFGRALEKVSWWVVSRKSPEQWFQEADVNGDKQLSMKEFAHICTSNNHIENLCQRADRDSNGDLTPPDTAAYIRNSTHGQPTNRAKNHHAD